MLFDLSTNTINDSLVSEIGLLTRLEVLSLFSNAMTLNLPTELGQLQKLTVLRLFSNAFSGTLISEIGNLTNLQVLALNDCNFEQTIPSEVGLLSFLNFIDLVYNSLTGWLPSEFRNLQNLSSIQFGDNSLSGTIPSYWTANNGILVLSLSGNLFSGTVNFNLSSSSMPGIETIDLGGNILSGPVLLIGSFPSSKHLNYINLGGNYFTGSVVIDIQNSPLQTLQLSGCYFTGSLTSNIGYFTTMNSLFLDGNYFSNSLPTIFGLLTQLTQLWIYSNLLTGHVGYELSYSRSLLDLQLNSNCLTGVFPSEVILMSSLKYLSADNNAFTGQLPASLTNLLQELNIFSNSFSGLLPANLGVLSALSAANNFFSGSVPVYRHGNISSGVVLTTLSLAQNMMSGNLDFLLSMSNLAQLDMENNFVTGSIPSQISQVPFVDYFAICSVENNFLSSTLPRQLFEMELEELIVSNNYISGFIPETLSMSSVNAFFASTNMFEGSLPRDINAVRTVYAFDVSNNNLTGTIPRFLLESNYSVLVVLVNNSLEGNFHGLTFGRSLEQLEASNNQLTGSFPMNLGISLQSLDLRNNRLSGELNVSCDSATHLSDLFIGGNSFFGTLEKLECFTNLTILDVSNNSFTGSIEVLQLIPNIEQIIVSQNKLTGTLPSFLGSHAALRVLIVSDNQFYGQPDVIFNASVQTLLTAVDLSSNDFSGSVPSVVFTLPILESFSSIKTCFSGTLPSSICGCSTLKVLLMDGVTSGLNCQRRFDIDLVAGSDAYVSRKGSLIGGIPTCVWNDLPLLASLHLSSNGLTGTIGPVNGGSNLTSIVLSYNQLSGTIPEELMSLPFTTLELSNNRLKGTVNGDLQQSDAVVSLENNRLSGFLPASFSNGSEINVMLGNLIDCNADHHKPAADPHAEETSCGSSQLNDALVVWGTVAGVLIMTLIVLALSGKVASVWAEVALLRKVGSATFVQTLENVAYMFGAKGDSSYRGYIDSLRLNCRDLIPLDGRRSSLLTYVVMVQHLYSFQVLMFCVVSVLICIPVYLGIKFVDDGKYASHTYQYQWLVSATFLTGIPPGVCVLCIWITSMLVFVRIIGVADMTSRSISILVDTLGDEAASKSLDNATPADNEPVKHRPKRQHWRYLGCTCLGIIHFVAMAGLNGAYLYIILSGDFSTTVMSLAQVSVSVVKVAWDSTVIPGGIQLLKRALGESKTTESATSGQGLAYVALAFCCSLLTAVVIPFIASLFVNSLCFLDVFVPVSVVNENFYYNVANKVACVTVQLPTINRTLPFDAPPLPTTATDCMSFGNVQSLSTEFLPPFTYSFQCGSGILTSYIPVLIYSFTFRILAVAFHKPWHSLKANLWDCWKRRNDASVSGDLQALAEASVRRILQGGHFVSNLVVYCVILMTFGLASPPLAGIILFCATAELIWHLYLIAEGGSQTETLGAESKHAIESAMERYTEALWKFPLKCMWPCVHLASIFWALMVLDMIGDTVAQHPERAWWGPFLVCMIPCIIRLGVYVASSRKRFSSRQPAGEATDKQQLNGDSVSSDVTHSPMCRDMTVSVDEYRGMANSTSSELSMTSVSTAASVKGATPVALPSRTHHNSRF
jgi:Leucine-rich repeat (LRR) protein